MTSYMGRVHYTNIMFPYVIFSAPQAFSFSRLKQEKMKTGNWQIPLEIKQEKIYSTRSLDLFMFYAQCPISHFAERIW